MTATFSHRVSSAPAATVGTLELQTKPLLAASDATASADGQTTSIDEIVSTTAVYLKGSLVAAVTGQTRKPWAEMRFARLSGSPGASFASVLLNMPNGDPLTETAMLAAANNVRSLGTQVVNGIRTTHYTGSFTASAGLASLPPALREEVAPLLTMVSGDIRFDAWIDANHVVRRISEVEDLGGETVHSTMNVTSVNRPVHIAVPPASETVVLPKNVFIGA